MTPVLLCLACHSSRTGTYRLDQRRSPTASRRPRVCLASLALQACGRHVPLAFSPLRNSRRRGKVARRRCVARGARAQRRPSATRHRRTNPAERIASPHLTGAAASPAQFSRGRVTCTRPLRPQGTRHQTASRQPYNTVRRRDRSRAVGGRVRQKQPSKPVTMSGLAFPFGFAERYWLAVAGVTMRHVTGHCAPGVA